MDFEGRGSARIDSENLLAFRLFDADGRVFHEGMVKTLDISRTGVSIQSSVPMEKGLRIEITIGIGDDVVKARGIVRNQHQLDDNTYQVGIEFEFLSEDDLNKMSVTFPSILK